MPDDSFKEFVLDQLAALPELRAKAMFGAHGIYSGEHFFGILDGVRVFFKTDATTAKDFTGRGMPPFPYQMKGKKMTMGYHEVPPDILEQPHELVLWGAQSYRRCRREKAGQEKGRAEPKAVGGDCPTTYNCLKTRFSRVSVK